MLWNGLIVWTSNSVQENHNGSRGAYVRFRSFLFPFSGVRMKVFYIEKQKIEQADLKDWISLLPSNLMEEISPNPEILHADT